MKYFRRFVLMLQFLTTIPVRMQLDATEEDFGKGLVFAPVVGLLLGGILAGAYLVLEMLFPVQVAAALVIAVYIMMTGGLHLDGLGDTFDGLFSNRSKERMLEIMRDSRVGTNAVLALIILLLVNFTSIMELPNKLIPTILLLVPVAGRIGSLVGAGVSGYARSGEGLGKSFIDHCGYKEIFIGLLPYHLIFLIVLGVPGLLISIAPPLTAFAVIKLFSRKIGGATGDLLGAVCEINQTMFMLLILVVVKFTPYFL